MSAGSFSRWLALREAADAAARSPRLVDEVGARLAPHKRLSILDLAAGTGSNLRYVAPRLAAEQQWLLVDHNSELLEEVSSRMPILREASDPGSARPGDRLRCSVETRCIDLGPLERPDVVGIFSGRQLVTASAFLDLVSERWLDILAARCRASSAVVLLALTYNGLSSCSPIEPEDDFVRDLMNRHQRMNSGLGGPAVGPDGVNCAERSLAAAGYSVRREASNWTLSPGQGELQKQLIEGWAHAAAEIAPEHRLMIQAWLGRRLAHIEGGRSNVLVGHEDLAAWLR